MYLKSIHLQNTGPITAFSLTLPFDASGNPKPVILVGSNGSGKSTVLSFAVNGLEGLRQKVFENAEIEKDKVYRVRSSLGIRGGENFYYANLQFEEDAHYREWQLDRAKADFIALPSAASALPSWSPNPIWDAIQPHENERYDLGFGLLNDDHKLEKHLKANCLLFFPADRFELPDWLNAESLSPELKLPEHSQFKGRTSRRFFARNRLKPTLEWLTSVVLDMLLLEHPYVTLPVATANGKAIHMGVRMPTPGAGTAIYNSVCSVLTKILEEKPGDQLNISIGNRQSRILGANLTRNGKTEKTIRNLLSLSAGESALFCMFASIIRDADLAGMQFSSPADIRGTVLIDEADLHLHLSLQHKVLPKLVKMFPKVQFIITAHSPLFVLGMQKEFGDDGFQTLEMPSGQPIDAERYTEFLSAYGVLAETKKFQDEVMAQASTQSKPVLLVEGKTDAMLITAAWKSLNPSVDMPFLPIGCGAEGGNGGARNLNSALRYLSGVFDKKVVALFDNDKEGSDQFKGLQAPEFQSIDAECKKHSSRDIHAILLPTPPGRTDFVPTEPAYRLLATEHYFDDACLSAHGLKGSSPYPGTSVFGITGNKVAFATAAASFDASAFANFQLLFSKVQALLVPAVPSVVPPALVPSQAA